MRRSSLVGFALALLLAPVAVHAQCTINASCILPPGSCAYVALGSSVQYGINYAQNWLVLENSFTCDPLPALNTSSNTFFSATSSVRLSSDGGSTYTGYSAPAQVGVHVTTTGQNGNDKTFQTELVQLDLSGGSLPANTRLRESPTLPSLGQGQSVDQGGGNFTITSFFDVFTELSVDGGQSWVPSSGPIRIDLQQGPPLPAHLSTWGAVKAIYR